MTVAMIAGDRMVLDPVMGHAGESRICMDTACDHYDGVIVTDHNGFDVHVRRYVQQDYYRWMRSPAYYDDDECTGDAVEAPWDDEQYYCCEYCHPDSAEPDDYWDDIDAAFDWHGADPTRVYVDDAGEDEWLSGQVSSNASVAAATEHGAALTKRQSEKDHAVMRRVKTVHHHRRRVRIGCMQVDVARRQSKLSPIDLDEANEKPWHYHARTLTIGSRKDEKPWLAEFRRRKDSYR